MANGATALDARGPGWGVPEDGIELRYAAGAIRADLARAAAGLALASAAIAARPPWPVALGLVGLAALFATFLLQTRRRGRSAVRLGAHGITLVLPSSRSRRLAWRDLERLRLRWFGPRRPGAGWLDLELRGGGERLTLNSSLGRFDLVLDQAVRAAERNGVELGPVTRANLAAVRGSVRDDRPGSWAPRG